MAETGLNMEAARRRVMVHGPDRVVIDPSGEAVPSRIARARHHIVPDVIFIRRDGWTLAAPKRFEHVAFAIWPDEWIGFMRRPSWEVFPISEYGGIQ